MLVEILDDMITVYISKYIFISIEKRCSLMLYVEISGIKSSQRSFPDGIVQNPGYPAGFVAGIAWDFVPSFLGNWIAGFRGFKLMVFQVQLNPWYGVFT